MATSPRSRITDQPQYCERLDRKLADFGLMEGDLVTLQGHGLNSGGIIYRIAKDTPPRKDAIYGRYTEYRRRSWGGPGKGNEPLKRDGWVDARGYAINDTRLFGAIELVPVFSFMPFPAGPKGGRKLVAYRRIARGVKKVDLVTMASAFASFKLFLDQELKRLQGE